MIKKILLGLAALIIIFLVVVALQPAEFRYSRSATLSAPRATLFEYVNDQRKFQEWNPWMKLDPTVKNTFSGPDAGVGSVCNWQGNKDIGAGTSTIIESRPGELVRFKMDWKEPMEATSTADFTFKPEGDKTLVTWSMYGPNNFLSKAMGLFMNCEKMCNDQFDKGLVNLDAVAKAAAK